MGSRSNSKCNVLLSLENVVLDSLESRVRRRSLKLALLKALGTFMPALLRFRTHRPGE